MTEGPLHGIRVLELSQIVAGPFSGIILSDLGAEVVKLESPTGDPHRDAAAVVPKEGKRFQSLNRGKRSLVIDLRSPRGRGVVYRLLPHFDILTMNYRPGVAERLGVDYATLSRLHPPLIYCAVSGFDSAGPLAASAASDIIATAYSGLMAGDEKVEADGAPAQLFPSIADYTTGLASVTGILAALYHRTLTGRGQMVRSSLLRSALAIQDTTVMREPVSDSVLREPMIEELGRAMAEGAGYERIIAIRQAHRSLRGFHRCYYGGYQTHDRPIVLGALTPATRTAVRRTLGITDDPSDQPGFNALTAEAQAMALRLKDRIQAHLLTRTAAEWLADFAVNGVPAAPVNLPEEMADDPQVVGAGLMVELQHEVTGPQRVAGPIVELSETPTRATRAAPSLGAHTDEVLLECAFTDSEIVELRDQGVVG